MFCFLCIRAYNKCDEDPELQKLAVSLQHPSDFEIQATFANRRKQGNALHKERVSNLGGFTRQLLRVDLGRNKVVSGTVNHVDVAKLNLSIRLSSPRI